MTTSRIAQLSHIIARDTAVIDEYCVRNNIPSPSLDYHAPPTVNIPPAEPDVQAAKDNVIAASRELKVLLAGPATTLLDVGFIDAFVYQSISRFRIAEHVPSGEEVTFEDLSKKCGLAESNLRRILRFAMTNGLFVEPRPGYVAHTSLSRVLADDEFFRQACAFSLEENFPASARATDAFQKDASSQEPTSSGWGLANQAQVPFFQELQQRYPERHRVAIGAMNMWDSLIPAAPLRDNYPWTDMSTVVDIGGGHGPVSVTLAQHSPTTKFIVQDLAAVVAGGQARVPADVRERVTFMEHDMFQPQPIKDADVYFFRSVFHDWPDRYCVQILKALVPALKPGARVVINDSCMPPAGTLPPVPNRAKRYWDLNMMLLFNGVEREEQQWGQIFREADPRFRFLGVQAPTKNVEGLSPEFLLNIIEAVWEP